MAGSSSKGIQVVSGELETSRAMTRLVIPTAARPAWPPFVRVGETVVTRSRLFPVHYHERQEVLTYVTEGFASYELESGGPEELHAGSARLLYAPVRASHRISPARGGAIRWFSLVVDAPSAPSGEVRLQRGDRPSGPPIDGSPRIWTLVGTGGSMRSRTEMECREITFPELGTTFQRVGHDRRGIVYALAGRGAVDGVDIASGEAALIEGVAGIAIQGSIGFRSVVATMPLSDS